MTVQTLEHLNIISQEPQVLLSWTMLCRKSWEDFYRRKHNGLTQQQRLQLLQEFYSMKDVVRDLIPESAKVEGDTIEARIRELEEQFNQYTKTILRSLFSVEEIKEIGELSETSLQDIKVIQKLTEQIQRGE